MPMKNPPHPGLHVRLDCLDPLGLSVTEGAKVLGVTRQAGVLKHAPMVSRAPGPATQGLRCLAR